MTEKAAAYLKEAAARGSVLGLSRITELLGLLGDPQNKIKTVHVSGTNGKGSFGAMLTSVLKSAGYKVGGFSSPAITDITDSFRIDCESVSDEELSAVIENIAAVCERMKDKPTEFELYTAAAFELFARRSCDIAVVECGMGGDLDSTNVIKSPVLSVITNVSRDHCAFLGDTIEEIALHKSGIIKPGSPVLFGGDSSAAYGVVSEKARISGSRLYCTDLSRISDVSSDLDGTEFDFSGFGRIKLSLLGAYQPFNAANVLTAIEILRENGFNISDEAVRDGLRRVRWHGRFEVLCRDPYVIFDGSHNPDGICSAVQSIQQYFGKNKVALLIGVMADKEYNLYADMLHDYAETIFAVTPDNPRALDGKILAETFSQKGIAAQSFDSVAHGVQSAYKYAKEKNIPLIALGSLYMYKEFTSAFNKEWS